MLLENSVSMLLFVFGIISIFISYSLYRVSNDYRTTSDWFAIISIFILGGLFFLESFIGL